MTRIIFFISLYLLPLFLFGQSDNPSAHLDKSHIQLIRDNKRYFLKAGENGEALVSQDGELMFSTLGGDGGDSLRFDQVDSLVIAILYSGDTEIARDSFVIEAVGGASTLNDVSVGSTTSGNSIYDMTATVPVEFESSDNNTILYLDETNERIGIKTASPAAALHLGSGALRITDLTASQIVATDANKDLQTLTTATYPSLTELSYVKGVTSAIQTQLGTKINGAGSLTAGYIPVASGTGTIANSSFDENTGSFVTNITRGVSVGDLSASTAAGNGFRLQRGTLTAGFFATGSDAYFQSTSNHPVRFRTNATDIMMLHINQIVSIGTTSTAGTGRLWVHDATLAGSGSLNGQVLQLTQTWNTTGSPTAIKLSVTNTASGATSKLIDLEVVGSGSQFNVNKAGTLTLPEYDAAKTAAALSKTDFADLRVSTDGTVIVDTMTHIGQMNFTDSAYTITITGIEPITNAGNNLFSHVETMGNVTIAGDSITIPSGNWVTLGGFISLSGTGVYKLGLTVNGTEVNNYGAHHAVAGDTQTLPIHYSYYNTSGTDIIKPTIEVISGVDTTPEIVGGSITVKIE